MRYKGRQSKQQKGKPRRRREAFKRKRKEEGTVQQYSEREKKKDCICSYKDG